MKIPAPLRTLLAALSYTGAQRLIDRARRLDPTLPAVMYVVKTLWCQVPDYRRLITLEEDFPHEVVELRRYPWVTLAVVEECDGERRAYVLLNHRETPYAMLGRDSDGNLYDPDNYGVPGAEHETADMDALIRTARAIRTPGDLN